MCGRHTYCTRNSIKNAHRLDNKIDANMESSSFTYHPDHFIEEDRRTRNGKRNEQERRRKEYIKRLFLQLETSLPFEKQKTKLTEKDVLQGAIVHIKHCHEIIKRKGDRLPIIRKTPKRKKQKKRERKERRRKAIHHSVDSCTITSLMDHDAYTRGDVDNSSDEIQKPYDCLFWNTMQQWDSVIDDNGIGVGYGENDIGVEHFDIKKFVDEL